MARVAAACRGRGAARVSVAAAHGLFTGGAEAMWREPAIDEVVVTDTVPVTSLNEAARKRLVILQAADLFADAIKSLVGEAHHRQADP
ncbi:MAG: hypothetical protein ABW003_19690, partial [Microvirga sp.]